MPYRLAEFDSPEALLAAARALRAKGYARLDAYTPFAVPELFEVLAVPPPRTPILMFGAGVTGAVLGALVQWWCNAYDYPLNVGSRPLSSLPAWVPIVFELTVLSSAAAGFVLMLRGAGLPRLYHPIDRLEGIQLASRDRFMLAIDLADPSFVSGSCRELLVEHGASAVRDDEEVA